VDTTRRAGRPHVSRLQVIAGERRTPFVETSAGLGADTSRVVVAA
jgi:hypothetical protein